MAEPKVEGLSKTELHNLKEGHFKLKAYYEGISEANQLLFNEEGSGQLKGRIKEEDNRCQDNNELACWMAHGLKKVSQCHEARVFFQSQNSELLERARQVKGREDPYGMQKLLVQSQSGSYLAALASVESICGDFITGFADVYLLGVAPVADKILQKSK